MDIRTLAWSLILVLGVLAGLGTVIALYRRDRAVTTWVAGLAGSGLGFLALVLQPLLPGAIAPLIGNALVLSFDVLLPVGFAFFVGEPRPWKRRFSAYLGLWVCLMLWFTVGVPSYPVRAALTSGFIALFTGEFLWLLRRRGGSITVLLRRVVWFTGGSFLVFHAVRALLMPSTGAPTLLSDQAYTALTLFITLGFLVLWGGVLLLLDTSRLRDQALAQAAELGRLNDLKDRVLAMTSHDLRGPLGSLQVIWADLADRVERGQCDEVDRQLFALVDRSLAGTQSLLENLFSFAEAQKSDPDPTAVTELLSAAQTVVEQWSGPAQAKGVNLAAVAGDAVLVRADPESVLTVLRNLVGNAVKFTPGGGSVKVSVGVGPEGVWCLVADTGIGVDPALLPGPSSLETRSSRPGTLGERGSGFGLVLVRELLDQWGGRLDFDSAPGAGTRVRISFPKAV